MIEELLTEIRKIDAPAHLKAALFVEKLGQIGVKGQAVDCDVCLDDFLPLADFLRLLDEAERRPGGLEKTSTLLLRDFHPNPGCASTPRRPRARSYTVSSAMLSGLLETRDPEGPGCGWALAGFVGRGLLYLRKEVKLREVRIDLSTLYTGTAKLDELASYVQRALELAGEGQRVVLTGQAPIWMYLKIAHALHGKARTLVYSSPVTGEVVVFDHNPF